MKASEAILKIKALFEDMPEEPKKEEEKEVKVEMKEYQLKDGVKVMISALEVGGMVEMEDGSPAPDGEHQLADGQIMVTEGGAIKEIKQPEQEVEIEVEAGKKIEEMQSAFNETIDQLKKENQKLHSELSQMKDKMKNGFTEVIALIETMSKVPQADPVQKPQSFKYVNTNDIKIERLNKYREAILNQATK